MAESNAEQIQSLLTQPDSPFNCKQFQTLLDSMWVQDIKEAGAKRDCVVRRLLLQFFGNTSLSRHETQVRGNTHYDL